jgi:hypothetical protein
MNASSSYLNGTGQQIMAVHPSQKSKLERIQQVAKNATHTMSPIKSYVA